MIYVKCKYQFGHSLTRSHYFTDTVDNHIENVYGNVELGAQELVKGSNYQSKFRRKVYLLLLLAIIVVIVLIIILVTKLS